MSTQYIALYSGEIPKRILKEKCYDKKKSLHILGVIKLCAVARVSDSALFLNV